ncbi:MAG: tyrosine recombinase XerC [Puniceicoccales bacterium]|nr:tyrosine recombinase XerC [Puniceicoccales bacterium]
MAAKAGGEGAANDTAAGFPGGAQVRAFIATLRGARGMSPHTIRNYTQALRDFCRWAADYCGFDGDFRGLSRRAIRDFIIEKQRTHSRATLHNHLAALRALFRHLLRSGTVETSPLLGLRSPKLPKQLPRFLTEKQTAALLAAPGKLHESGRIDAWVRTRDEAVLELLYGAGLRVAELCGLDHAHVDAGAGLVRVLGKGRKTRLIPAGAIALAALQRLRRISPFSNTADSPVFTTGPGTAKRLTPRAVQLLLKRHLAAADLPPDLTPHKLRHTCATHLLDHDADLRAIQEQLGHASLSTTQIYAHVSLARLKKTHALSHPRA